MAEKILRIKAKKGREKIAALTAYDYPTAKLVEEAGIDFILVGDSLGVVVLGYENPLPVTMDDMVHHTKAVARGAKNTLIVGDMPVNTHNTPRDAIKNAKRFIGAGAQAVKTEGCNTEVVEALIKNNIPVMGHLGLTPQTMHDYKVRGRGKAEAQRILGDAKALDEAGIFALVLECIPEKLGRQITEAISVPTIGIGAGRYCDGQILVLHDLLGLFDRYVPKFARQYVNLRKDIKDALLRYRQDVLQGNFPSEENVYY
ncbi:MAG: 3-methyl-2-oxobutanoate hydroxymethyltransferase [Candidatus Hydrothermarchaeota archaeon]|nr:3-methyl-2-oxobutanoate hydroxymethyltransferase [Candidatus Hydrothermarchaeota archaeon]